MKWFRLYHSVLDSVKVRRLPEAAQLDYLYLLCCASEYRERTRDNSGNTGLSSTDAAWRCRRDSLPASVTLLERHGLVMIAEDQIVMTDWADRQYPHTDDAYERVKAHRKRKRDEKQDVKRFSNVSVTPSETDTDTDTDTDTEKNRGEATAAAQEVPRGYLMTAEFKRAAQELRPDWDAKQTLKVFHDWRDHYVARGTRLRDFVASWRKWVRNERAPPADRRKTLAERNRDNMDVLTGKVSNVRTIEGISARVDSAPVLTVSSDLREQGDCDVGSSGPGRGKASLG